MRASRNEVLGTKIRCVGTKITSIFTPPNTPYKHVLFSQSKLRAQILGIWAQILGIWAQIGHKKRKYGHNLGTKLIFMGTKICSVGTKICSPYNECEIFVPTAILGPRDGYFDPTLFEWAQKTARSIARTNQMCPRLL